MQWSSFNFTYGTVEFRAKTAGGRGSWPAVWLLRANCQASNIVSADNVGACNWPQPGSDEIDILEMTDNNYMSVTHNMFVSSGGQTCSQDTTDTSQNWHVYTIHWTASKITFSVDGQLANCSYTNGVPSHPMFLIINNALAPTSNSQNWPVVPGTSPKLCPSATSRSLSRSGDSAMGKNRVWPTIPAPSIGGDSIGRTRHSAIVR